MVELCEWRCLDPPKGCALGWYVEVGKHTRYPLWSVQGGHRPLPSRLSVRYEHGSLPRYVGGVEAWRAAAWSVVDVGKFLAVPEASVGAAMARGELGGMCIDGHWGTLPEGLEQWLHQNVKKSS